MVHIQSRVGMKKRRASWIEMNSKYFLQKEKYKWNDILPYKKLNGNKTYWESEHWATENSFTDMYKLKKALLKILISQASLE